jgi:hypothetical protein
VQCSVLTLSRFGPVFMGMVFNVMLYGVMTTQVYLYYAKYKG